MRAPIIFTYLVCVLTSTNFVALETDTLLPQKDPPNDRAEVGLNELEIRLDELEARLEEIQQLFDETLTNKSDLSRIERFRDFFPRLNTTVESLNKGFIGVQLGDATAEGVPITQVVEGSPANIARIEAGDLITKVNDVDISEAQNPVESTVESINVNPPGSIVQITLLRDGKKMVLDVATVRRSTIAFEDIEPYQLPSNLRNLSDRLNTLISPNLEGLRNMVYVIVMEIEEDFARYFGVKNGVLVLHADTMKDIRPGDILLEIDDKPIRTEADAIRQKRDADDEMTILVKRNNRTKQLTIEKDLFSFRTILK